MADVLGEDFERLKLVTVEFRDLLIGTSPQRVEPAKTAQRPGFSWAALQAWELEVAGNVYYSIFVLDPDHKSRDDTNLVDYVHFCAVNMTNCELNEGTTKLEIVSEYDGLRPLYGSGSHRATVLVYVQPALLDDAAYAEFQQGMRGRRGKKVHAWCQDHGFDLYAANMFECEWDEWVDKEQMKTGFIPPKEFRSPMCEKRIEMDNLHRTIRDQRLVIIFLILALGYNTLPWHQLAILILGMYFGLQHLQNMQKEILVEGTVEEKASVKKVFEYLKQKETEDSVSVQKYKINDDERLETMCKRLRQEFGWFMDSKFLTTVYNTFMPHTDFCVTVCEANKRLIAEAGWNTREMMSAAALRPCLDTRFQMLLPHRTKENWAVFYVHEDRLRFDDFDCEWYMKVSHYLMRKPTTDACGIVNFEGLALSEFRKITKRQIEIGLLFVNCAPIFFKRVYFVNVPWWIQIVKALVPKKHAKKILFYTVDQLKEELGSELLPSEIGGDLLMKDVWKTTVDTWVEEEKDLMLKKLI